MYIYTDIYALLMLYIFSIQTEKFISLYTHRQYQGRKNGFKTYKHCKQQAYKDDNYRQRPLPEVMESITTKRIPNRLGN